MKFVLPLEKMKDGTIKLIAEDLGCPVDFKDCVKEFMENGEVDTNKFDEVKKKHVAEVQKWLLENGYILTDDIYHIYDEDFYDFLANQEVTDIFDKIWELHEAVDKIPVDKRKKQDIFDDLMLTEVYDKLCKKMIKFFEDRCQVDKNRD